MNIIKIEPNANGSRPPLQKWVSANIPSGYALCPNNFCDVFYSTSPAGFVNITIEDNTVVDMTINEEALARYIEENPVVEPQEEEPTAQDDIDAMLVDHEYRLTLLELGV